MKYCTNCGRQLADDEVCTCRQQAQTQAPNQTQDNAQADNAAQQAQFNGQPQGNAQAQFNGQPQPKENNKTITPEDSHRATHRHSSTDSHRAMHSRRRLTTSHSR